MNKYTRLLSLMIYEPQEGESQYAQEAQLFRFTFETMNCRKCASLHKRLENAFSCGRKAGSATQATKRKELGCIHTRIISTLIKNVKYFV